MALVREPRLDVGRIGPAGEDRRLEDRGRKKSDFDDQM
jgi:hypothetical protein